MIPLLIVAKIKRRAIAVAIIAPLASNVAILVTVAYNKVIYGILNREIFYENFDAKKTDGIPSFHEDLALRSAGRLIMRVHCFQ
jgi:hypothetical protein